MTNKNNMEKLELKHLIDAYKYQDDIYEVSDLWKITNINDDILTLSNGLHFNEVWVKHFSLDYSVVKRPLSDLTKEIEVNGEKFIPIEVLECEGVNISLGIWGLQIIQDKNNEWIWLSDIYENISNKLFEWHFDVFGLIEKGLAIDINTLNNEKD